MAFSKYRTQKTIIVIFMIFEKSTFSSALHANFRISTFASTGVQQFRPWSQEQFL